MNKPIVDALLQYSGTSPGLQLSPIPDEIGFHLHEAWQFVDQAEAVAAQGSHADYFRVSKERYAHYVAAALAHLTHPSKVLDIGNAPGHVANMFSVLGHEIHGVNLNAEYHSTYPDPNWLDRFHVIECNIESELLPYDDRSFDAVLFTEVLEHIAITDPKRILPEFGRILRTQGIVIFSTPNICNISNIFALLNGENIFWAPQLFYGSHDRHNREYTPREVQGLFAGAGFEEIALWGMSDHSNWRGGGAKDAYEIAALYGMSHPLLRNTIIGIFRPLPS